MYSQMASGHWFAYRRPSRVVTGGSPSIEDCGRGDIYDSCIDTYVENPAAAKPKVFSRSVHGRADDTGVRELLNLPTGRKYVTAFPCLEQAEEAQ